jgi:hypothetical protein
MKVVYARRAVRDLQSIGAHYRSVADEKTAEGAAERIELIVNLIGVTRILHRVSGSAPTCDQLRSCTTPTLFSIEFAAMQSKSYTFATRHADPGKG